MDKSRPNKAIKHLALSILSGLLLILLFPNFSLSFLAWIALLPLLFVIYRETAKVSFFQGWLAGTIFFLGLTCWLLTLYPLVNGLAILAWAGLAVFEGGFIGVFAAGAGVIRKNYAGWARLFIIPVWWVSLEFVRSVGWWGFPWGILGYSQQSFPALTQIATITGVYGISFLILMMNVSLIEILVSPAEKLRSSFGYLGVALIILINVVVSGFYVLKSSAKNDVASSRNKASFRVVAAQGNISQEDKWDPLKENHIKQVYYNLTKKAKNYKPYLVVWPETAHPSFLLYDEFYLNKLKDLAKRYNYFLLVGSLHLGNKSRQYNSAILISPQGKVLKRYEKLHLVLFGEYIPYKFIGDIFRRFEKLSWLGESITPGKDYTVFVTDKGKFSTVICFESTDSNLCRQMVRKGAQLLTVITNDAWFGKSAAGSQHLQISAFRAIENNVYVLQVANTGISAIVNPHGQILKKTSLFKRQLLNGTLSFRSSETLYLRWGDVFSYLCLFLVLGCFISVLLKKNWLP
jgi:apolipoprotein N-acyltransferase